MASTSMNRIALIVLGLSLAWSSRLLAQESATPSPRSAPSQPQTRRIKIEGLFTADPLPSGYQVVREAKKDENGKNIGDVLVIARDKQLSKVVLTIDRVSKVDTRPGRLAATKGYVNGSAQALTASGMKIVKKDLPDLNKANLDERQFFNLTLRGSGKDELSLQLQVFFASAGYVAQIIADKPDDFETLTTWARSLKPIP